MFGLPSFQTDRVAVLTETGDGTHPCETCQWYRKADSCHYTEAKQRQVPSRRSIEKISATLQDYRGILQQIFPSVHPDTLVNLPREKLLELINHHGTQQPPSPATSHGVHSEAQLSPVTAEAGSLEALQVMPEEESSDGSDYKDPHAVPGISDDVNALSLSIKQTSSYLGISSIMAVLRVILWIDPECQSVLSRSPDRTQVCSREQTAPPDRKLDRTPLDTSPARDGIMVLNAYFTYIHPMIPLVEEQSFRETYLSGRRHDSRWLALLNIVFAMGSIAATNSEDSTHDVYYRRARKHLGFDCLGSAHLETVQALAIMGGYYLHYIQQPNLANAVMGASLRMATSLGLHREYVEGRSRALIHNPAFSEDMRRRIWWCIFNLDTWAGATLGRPSMGRWGHAITVKSPMYSDDRGQGISILALNENVTFCKIATALEDALATSPLVPPMEAASLDAQFVSWFNNLPPLLQSNTPCPENVFTVRAIMRWRYQAARMILHRPVFLSYALRRMPAEAIRAEEKEAIDKCRAAAAETIEDIATSFRPNQFSGWNATWQLYQASMVPLLSLFSDYQNPEIVESASRQIECALSTFARMERWSQTAKRSHEVVSRIFEVSKIRAFERQEARIRGQATGINAADDMYGANPPMMSHSQIFGDMDYQNAWDSLNWSSGFETLDYPFNDMGSFAGSGWDYGGLGAGGEGLAFEAMFAGQMQGINGETMTPINLASMPPQPINPATMPIYQ
ncbi:MAG: hypothetical protein Q9227_006919 [Pyrenula ochraceoflavens]